MKNGGNGVVSAEDDPQQKHQDRRPSLGAVTASSSSGSDPAAENEASTTTSKSAKKTTRKKKGAVSGRDDSERSGDSIGGSGSKKNKDKWWEVDDDDVEIQKQLKGVPSARALLHKSSGSITQGSVNSLSLDDIAGSPKGSGGSSKKLSSKKKKSGKMKRSGSLPLINAEYLLKQANDAATGEKKFKGSGDKSSTKTPSSTTKTKGLKKSNSVSALPSLSLTKDSTKSPKGKSMKKKSGLSKKYEIDDSKLPPSPTKKSSTSKRKKLKRVNSDRSLPLLPSIASGDKKLKKLAKDGKKKKKLKKLKKKKLKEKKSKKKAAAAAKRKSLNASMGALDLDATRNDDDEDDDDGSSSSDSSSEDESIASTNSLPVMPSFEREMRQLQSTRRKSLTTFNVDPELAMLHDSNPELGIGSLLTPPNTSLIDEWFEDDLLPGKKEAKSQIPLAVGSLGLTTISSATTLAGAPPMSGPPIDGPSLLQPTLPPTIPASPLSSMGGGSLGRRPLSARPALNRNHSGSLTAMMMNRSLGSMNFNPMISMDNDEEEEEERQRKLAAMSLSSNSNLGSLSKALGVGPPSLHNSGLFNNPMVRMDDSDEDDAGLAGRNRFGKSRGVPNARKAPQKSASSGNLHRVMLRMDEKEKASTKKKGKSTKDTRSRSASPKRGRLGRSKSASRPRPKSTAKPTKKKSTPINFGSSIVKPPPKRNRSKSASRKKSDQQMLEANKDGTRSRSASPISKARERKKSDTNKQPSRSRSVSPVTERKQQKKERGRSASADKKDQRSRSRSRSGSRSRRNDRSRSKSRTRTRQGRSQSRDRRPIRVPMAAGERSAMAKTSDEHMMRSPQKPTRSRSFVLREKGDDSDGPRIKPPLVKSQSFTSPKVDSIRAKKRALEKKKEELGGSDNWSVSSPPLAPSRKVPMKSGDETKSPVKKLSMDEMKELYKKDFPGVALLPEEAIRKIYEPMPSPPPAPLVRRAPGRADSFKRFAKNFRFRKPKESKESPDSSAMDASFSNDTSSRSLRSEATTDTPNSTEIVDGKKLSREEKRFLRRQRAAQRREEQRLKQQPGGQDLAEENDQSEALEDSASGSLQIEEGPDHDSPSGRRKGSFAKAPKKLLGSAMKKVGNLLHLGRSKSKRGTDEYGNELSGSESSEVIRASPMSSPVSIGSSGRFGDRLKEQQGELSSEAMQLMLDANGNSHTQVVSVDSKDGAEFGLTDGRSPRPPPAESGRSDGRSPRPRPKKRVSSKKPAKRPSSISSKPEVTAGNDDSDSSTDYEVPSDQESEGDDGHSQRLKTLQKFGVSEDDANAFLREFGGLDGADGGKEISPAPLASESKKNKTRKFKTRNKEESANSESGYYKEGYSIEEENDADDSRNEDDEGFDSAARRRLAQFGIADGDAEDFLRAFGGLEDPSNSAPSSTKKVPNPSKRQDSSASRKVRTPTSDDTVANMDEEGSTMRSPQAKVDNDDSQSSLVADGVGPFDRPSPRTATRRAARQPDTWTKPAMRDRDMDGFSSESSSGSSSESSTDSDYEDGTARRLLKEFGISDDDADDFLREFGGLGDDEEPPVMSWPPQKVLKPEKKKKKVKKKTTTKEKQGNSPSEKQGEPSESSDAVASKQDSGYFKDGYTPEDQDPSNGSSDFEDFDKATRRRLAQFGVADNDVEDFLKAFGGLEDPIERAPKPSRSKKRRKRAKKKKKRKSKSREVPNDDPGYSKEGDDMENEEGAEGSVGEEEEYSEGIARRLLTEFGVSDADADDFLRAFGGLDDDSNEEAVVSWPPQKVLKPSKHKSRKPKFKGKTSSGPSKKKSKHETAPSSTPVEEAAGDSLLKPVNDGESSEKPKSGYFKEGYVHENGQDSDDSSDYEDFDAAARRQLTEFGVADNDVEDFLKAFGGLDDPAERAPKPAQRARKVVRGPKTWTKPVMRDHGMDSSSEEDSSMDSDGSDGPFERPSPRAPKLRRSKKKTDKAARRDESDARAGRAGPNDRTSGDSNIATVESANVEGGVGAGNTKRSGNPTKNFSLSRIKLGQVVPGSNETEVALAPNHSDSFESDSDSDRSLEVRKSRKSSSRKQKKADSRRKEKSKKPDHDDVGSEDDMGPYERQSRRNKDGQDPGYFKDGYVHDDGDGDSDSSDEEYDEGVARRLLLDFGVNDDDADDFLREFGGIGDDEDDVGGVAAWPPQKIRKPKKKRSMTPKVKELKSATSPKDEPKAPKTTAQDLSASSLPQSAADKPSVNDGYFKDGYVHEEDESDGSSEYEDFDSAARRRLTQFGVADADVEDFLRAFGELDNPDDRAPKKPERKGWKKSMLKEGKSIQRRPTGRSKLTKRDGSPADQDGLDKGIESTSRSASEPVRRTGKPVKNFSLSRIKMGQAGRSNDQADEDGASSSSSSTSSSDNEESAARFKKAKRVKHKKSKRKERRLESNDVSPDDPSRDQVLDVDAARDLLQEMGLKPEDAESFLGEFGGLYDLAGRKGRKPHMSRPDLSGRRGRGGGKGRKKSSTPPSSQTDAAAAELEPNEEPVEPSIETSKPARVSEAPTSDEKLEATPDSKSSSGVRKREPGYLKDGYVREEEDASDASSSDDEAYVDAARSRLRDFGINDDDADDFLRAFGGLLDEESENLAANVSKDRHERRFGDKNYDADDKETRPGRSTKPRKKISLPRIAMGKPQTAEGASSDEESGSTSEASESSSSSNDDTREKRRTKKKNRTPKPSDEDGARRIARRSKKKEKNGEDQDSGEESTSSDVDDDEIAGSKEAHKGSSRTKKPTKGLSLPRITMKKGGELNDEDSASDSNSEPGADGVRRPKGKKKSKTTKRKSSKKYEEDEGESAASSESDMEEESGARTKSGRKNRLGYEDDGREVRRGRRRPNKRPEGASRADEEEANSGEEWTTSDSEADLSPMVKRSRRKPKVAMDDASRPAEESDEDAGEDLLPRQARNRRNYDDDREIRKGGRKPRYNIDHDDYMPRDGVRPAHLDIAVDDIDDMYQLPDDIDETIEPISYKQTAREPTSREVDESSDDEEVRPDVLNRIMSRPSKPKKPNGSEDSGDDTEQEMDEPRSSRRKKSTTSKGRSGEPVEESSDEDSQRDVPDTRGTKNAPTGSGRSKKPTKGLSLPRITSRKVGGTNDDDDRSTTSSDSDSDEVKKAKKERKKKSKTSKNESSKKPQAASDNSPKQDSGYFKEGYVREDDEVIEVSSEDEDKSRRRRRDGLSDDEADDFLKEFGGFDEDSPSKPQVGAIKSKKPGKISLPKIALGNTNDVMETSSEEDSDSSSGGSGPNKRNRKKSKKSRKDGKLSRKSPRSKKPKGVGDDGESADQSDTEAISPRSKSKRKNKPGQEQQSEDSTDEGSISSDGGDDADNKDANGRSASKPRKPRKGPSLPRIKLGNVVDDDMSTTSSDSESDSDEVKKAKKEKKKTSKTSKKKSSKKPQDASDNSPKQDSGYFKDGYVREEDEHIEVSSEDEDKNRRRRFDGLSDDEADDFLREFGGLGDGAPEAGGRKMSKGHQKGKSKLSRPGVSKISIGDVSDDDSDSGSGSDSSSDVGKKEGRKTRKKKKASKRNKNVNKVDDVSSASLIDSDAGRSPKSKAKKKVKPTDGVENSPRTNAAGNEERAPRRARDRTQVGIGVDGIDDDYDVPDDVETEQPGNNDAFAKTGRQRRARANSTDEEPEDIRRPVLQPEEDLPRHKRKTKAGKTATKSNEGPADDSSEDNRDDVEARSSTLKSKKKPGKNLSLPRIALGERNDAGDDSSIGTSSNGSDSEPGTKDGSKRPKKKKYRDQKDKGSKKTKGKGAASPKRDTGYFKKGYVREGDEDSEELSSDEEYDTHRGKGGYRVSEDDADDFLREFGGLDGDQVQEDPKASRKGRRKARAAKSKDDSNDEDLPRRKMNLEVADDIDSEYVFPEDVDPNENASFNPKPLKKSNRRVARDDDDEDPDRVHRKIAIDQLGDGIDEEYASIEDVDSADNAEFRLKRPKRSNRRASSDEDDYESPRHDRKISVDSLGADLDEEYPDIEDVDPTENSEFKPVRSTKKSKRVVDSDSEGDDPDRVRRSGLAQIGGDIDDKFSADYDEIEDVDPDDNAEFVPQRSRKGRRKVDDDEEDDADGNYRSPVMVRLEGAGPGAFNEEDYDLDVDDVDPESNAEFQPKRNKKNQRKFGEEDESNDDYRSPAMVRLEGADDFGKKDWDDYDIDVDDVDPSSNAEFKPERKKKSKRTTSSSEEEDEGGRRPRVDLGHGEEVVDTFKIDDDVDVEEVDESVPAFMRAAMAKVKTKMPTPKPAAKRGRKPGGAANKPARVQLRGGDFDELEDDIDARYGGKLVDDVDEDSNREFQQKQSGKKALRRGRKPTAPGGAVRKPMRVQMKKAGPSPKTEDFALVQADHEIEDEYGNRIVEDVDPLENLAWEDVQFGVTKKVKRKVKRGLQRSSSDKSMESRKSIQSIDLPAAFRSSFNKPGGGGFLSDFLEGGGDTKPKKRGKKKKKDDEGGLADFLEKAENSIDDDYAFLDALLDYEINEDLVNPSFDQSPSSPKMVKRKVRRKAPSSPGDSSFKSRQSVQSTDMPEAFRSGYAKPNLPNF